MRIRSAKEQSDTKIRRRLWVRKNPQRWAVINWRARLKRQYNTTPEEVQQMFDNQEGLCAICSQPMCLCAGVNNVRCKTRACIDHDHEKMIIRGLLHPHCNAGIGHFKDSPTLLRNAAVYLEVPR